MNLTSFRYFVKVAERMSFTRAAEELYISQQSVSTHIKRLEDEYHVELFERRPTLKLTAAGETLLLFAKEMIAADEILSDQLNTFHQDYYGTITVGLPPNRSNAFAMEFVPEYTKKFPNMTISLYEKTSSTLLEAVLQNEVDLAIILASAGENRLDPLVYRYRSLGDESLYAVIADSLLERCLPKRWPTCREAFQRGVDLVDIRTLPMIIRPSTSRVHHQIVEYLKDKGFSPSILLQSTNTSGLLPLVAQGYGVIFCTPMLLRMFQKEYTGRMEGMNIFPVRNFEHCHQAMLVWHKRKYLSTPVRECMELIQRMFTSQKPQLS